MRPSSSGWTSSPTRPSSIRSRLATHRPSPGGSTATSSTGGVSARTGTTSSPTAMSWSATASSTSAWPRARSRDEQRPRPGTATGRCSGSATRAPSESRAGWTRCTRTPTHGSWCPMSAGASARRSTRPRRRCCCPTWPGWSGVPSGGWRPARRTWSLTATAGPTSTTSRSADRPTATWRPIASRSWPTSAPTPPSARGSPRTPSGWPRAPTTSAPSKRSPTWC